MKQRSGHTCISARLKRGCGLSLPISTGNRRSSGAWRSSVKCLPGCLLITLFAIMSSGTIRRWRCPLPITWSRLPISMIVWTSFPRSVRTNGIKQHEAQLLRYADLVFTGGHSLYEIKRQQHARVYAFPSSVDVAHFAQARRMKQDPQIRHLFHTRAWGFME